MHSNPVEVPPQPLSSPLSTPELKQIVCTTVVPVPPEWIEERYCSYHRLLYVTAWAFRFTSNLKPKAKQTLNLSSTLTPLELKSAECFLFARSQDRHFLNERQRLTTGRPLKSPRTLMSLNPSLGDGGLLVVRGRLSNSSLTLSQQHPPILSSKKPLTRLLFLTLQPLSPSFHCRSTDTCAKSQEIGKDCLQKLHHV